MNTGVDLIRRDEFSGSYWDNAEELDGHFCHIRHLNNNSIIGDIACEQEKSSSGASTSLWY